MYNNTEVQIVSATIYKHKYHLISYYLHCKDLILLHNVNRMAIFT